MDCQTVKAWEVARALGYTTETIKVWARAGRLPGVIPLGNPGRQHIRFNREVIAAFIRGWDGRRPELPALPPQPEFTVRRLHVHHEHAGGPARNDRTRRDPSKALGELVKPDPGVRPFDPMETAPDLERVPARQYLPGGGAQV